MKYIFLAPLLMFFCQQVLAQSSYRDLDTLRTFDVNLDEQMTTWGRKYYANGKEVSKEQYMMFKEHWDLAQKCAPCILSTYDGQNRLKHTAVQYADCLVGEYREFHSNGNLKATGQFVQNPTSDWSNLRMRGLCNVKDGKWTYYNNAGKAEWVEFYEKGKLLSKEEAENEAQKTDPINKLKGLFKRSEQGGN
jgi:antitoxin component YwqK of YwqJK toxin-antitoxin module